MFYEWDADKAAANLAKHGVSFEQACTVFMDPYALTYQDSLHSEQEQRVITIGRAEPSNLLLVVSTDREDNVRIISARPTNASERKFYESQF
jgi:uncharacterized protein